MHSLILSHQTALAIWSNCKATQPNATLPKRSIQAALAHTAGALTRQNIDTLLSLPWAKHIPNELEVMVDSYAGVRHLANIKCHTQLSELPRGSLVPLGEPLENLRIFVASPELTFVQMASIMETPELIELGYELCGKYAIDPGSQFGFVERAPVCETEKLRAYLEQAQNIRGVKRARLAAKWVLNGSCSPKETNICQILCMPRKMGGFGLQPPSLNTDLALTPEYMRLLCSTTCSPDMLWKDARVILEYDSKTWHDSENRLERDATKRSFYQSMGYECITMTKGQLYDFACFASILESLDSKLRKAQGKGNARPSTILQREHQKELHRFLLYGKRMQRFSSASSDSPCIDGQDAAAAEGPKTDNAVDQE